MEMTGGAHGDICDLKFVDGNGKIGEPESWHEIGSDTPLKGINKPN